MTRSMRPPRLVRTDPAAPPAAGVPVPPAPRPTEPAPAGCPDTRPSGGPAPMPVQRPGDTPAAQRGDAGPGRTVPGDTTRHPGPDAHPSTQREEPHVTAAAELLEPEDGEGSWALVKASQNGDTAAFGRLYERYHDVVFRYIVYRMGDRQTAEDLTHETFLRALRRINSVTYQGRDIGAWFVTIARNLVFDQVKSSRHRLESTTDNIVDIAPPTTEGPEQLVLEGAARDALLRAIDLLNPDQRECIVLRFLNGLSVAETAVKMDRNEGAVKALQHRAVKRLAQLMPDGVR
ncbi:hypothetical protein PSU4_11130 [Pseudonocardia sulfidoxydans NBRC 16205]|uniref:RNA polymerase sigma factor n=2 Tax=Pseudonocardia sulfidoxydans TaxID=54011 RepID=A0A511DBH9_9PSEU|nr:hypothetical protein PSU4_11130 [Pseudonocardia sulfidoxydans NBRC 16205]